MINLEMIFSEGKIFTISPKATQMPPTWTKFLEIFLEEVLEALAAEDLAVLEAEEAEDLKISDLGDLVSRIWM